MAGENDSQAQELLKKRLQLFLADMVKFGCVKGFRYFAMYMRGREEMVLSVINASEDADTYSLCSGAPGSPLSISSGGHFSLGASFNSGNLPYDKRTLLMPGQTQQQDSAVGEGGLVLPPASPSDCETALGDPNTTLFLVAGYSKYESPHVWVRSNHERLIQYSGHKDKDKDKPLCLKSVRKWNDTDIKVWDVVAEVVKLCTYPPPRNPFSVDFSYFETLQPADRLLATGAMVHALQTIVASKVEDAYYTAKVMEDLQHITRLHFEALQELSMQRQLPCLEEYITQASQQAERQQAERQRHASGQYPTRYRHYSSSYQYAS